VSISSYDLVFNDKITVKKISDKNYKDVVEKITTLNYLKNG